MFPGRASGHIGILPRIIAKGIINVTKQTLFSILSFMKQALGKRLQYKDLTA